MTAPVRVVVGRDRWLREEALRRLLAAAPYADVVRLDATEGETAAHLARLREELVTPPLTGGRKAVVLAATAAFWQAAAELLAEHWEAGAGPTDVVVLLPAFPPGRHALRSRLEKAGAVIAVERPAERAAPWARERDPPLLVWAAGEARARGLELSRTLLQEICARVGREPGEVAAFLDVLALRYGRGPVPEEGLPLLANRRAGGDSFALADALLARDRRGALERLSGALREGLVVGERRLKRPEEWVPALLGLLHQRYRRLARFLEAEAAGEDPARALGVKPFLARLLRAEARRHTPAGLAAAVRALLTADSRLKQGGADPRAVLVDLVLTLTAPEGGA